MMYVVSVARLACFRGDCFFHFWFSINTLKVVVIIPVKSRDTRLDRFSFLFWLPSLVEPDEFEPFIFTIRQ